MKKKRAKSVKFQNAELFNFYLDKSMKTELKKIAYEQDLKIADLIRHSLSGLIKYYKSKEPKKENNGNP